MFNLDLAQAENRIVAYIAPEPRMIAAFEAGTDIHIQTAALILGKSTEAVTKEERQRIGKPANHGLNYGLGPDKASLLWEMPLAEAKFIIERYHAVYPGVRNGYHRYIADQIATTHILENCAPYCRRRYFLDRDIEKANAHIPSSTVADKMWEDGVIPLYRDQGTYGCLELLNTIHDSIRVQAWKAAGLEKVATALLSLITSLEKPIRWRITEFVIPVDLSWGMTGDEKNEHIVLTSRTVSELVTEIKMAVVAKEETKKLFEPSEPEELPDEDEEDTEEED